MNGDGAKGVLKSRKVVHRAALFGDELPEFMQALARADIDTATKLALQLTILTTARSGETRGGRLALWLKKTSSVFVLRH
ncbi:hypothetical protein LDFHOB_12105 [Candidatus Electronema aureum]